MGKKKKTRTEPTEPAPPPPPPIIDPDVPYHIWPPFPEVPPGVTIIPFKDFKPSGIRITIDSDEEEFDGEGIKTIMLKTIHDPDKSGRKKKKKKPLLAGEEPRARLPWWEEWDESEDLRTMSAIDPRLNHLDRFEQAGNDFQTGRRWSPALQSLWDHLRLFMGLMTNAPNPNQKKKRGEDDEGGKEEEVSDDEGEEDDDDDAEGNDDSQGGEARIVELEDSGMTREEEVKMERMTIFLEDPEKSMKVFFSSYFQDRGLMWAEAKLRDGPKLARFFLQYIVRNRALPEHDNSLKKAIIWINQAEKELPMTKKTAMIVPDEWAKACISQWGSQIPSAYGGLDMDVDPVPINGTGGAWHTSTPQPATETRPTPKGEDEEMWEAQLRGENIELVDSKNIPPEPPVVNINGTDMRLPPDAKVIHHDEDAWGQPTSNDNGGWGTAADDNPWAATTPSGAGWLDPGPQSTFFTYFGPTSLGLTHSVVRMEVSTRSIVSYTPPREDSPIHLLRTLGVLVMRPWKNIGRIEIHSTRPPEMLKPSGGVELEQTVVGEHDPTKDDIRVLVDPTRMETLLMGMGVGATWVQVARNRSEEGAEDPPPPGEKKRSRKKKSKATEDDEWWYVENVTQVLTSYWTEADERAS